MAIQKGHKIDQHLPSQDPPKFTQIWIFWLENITSGNPAVHSDQMASGEVDLVRNRPENPEPILQNPML
jgi:hypothetical protein